MLSLFLHILCYYLIIGIIFFLIIRKEVKKRGLIKKHGILKILFISIFLWPIILLNS